ncbi:WSC domain-containing protein [Xylariomycetidae sp. FL2044]|nr:WSC domain-containing protein [Xylariomycetidae sp. FL2044]
MAASYSFVSTDSILRNPTAPPFPTQTGIVPNCHWWMRAFDSGDYCDWFAGRGNMIPKVFYAYNPLLGKNGENCSNMFWAGYWYCVGTTSAPGATQTSGGTIVTITPTPASATKDGPKPTSAASGSGPAPDPKASSASNTKAVTVSTNTNNSNNNPAPVTQPPAASPTTRIVTLQVSSSSAPSPSSSPSPSPSTSAATQNPNSNSNLPPEISYLGCASEVSGRALNRAGTARADMTIQTCLRFCSSQTPPLPLAGLEYANECFCGTVLPPSSQSSLSSSSNTNNNKCAMPCAGDKTQICGGPGLLSVYRNASVADEVVPQKVDSVSAEVGAGGGGGGENNKWTYKGCFAEPQTGGQRALGLAMMGDDSLSLEKCVGFCGGKGYKLAGVEYARECWCGNEMKTSSSSSSSSTDAVVAVVDEKRCGMQCSGNKGQFCGGPGALGVYARGGGGGAVAKRGEDEENEDDYGGQQNHVVTKTVRMVRRGRLFGRHRPHAYA